MRRSSGNSSRTDFGDMADHWHWRHQRRRIAIVSFACLVLMTTMVPQASGDLANETAVLLGIKQAWGNPSELSTWSTRFNTCSWIDVECDSGNTTITQLSLFGTTTNVNSSLPASIGELVNLETLIVSSWGLTGEIPSSIGRLRNLTKLGLSLNSLTGAIPPAIGNLTKLTILDLSNNGLTGALPVQLSELRLLTSLLLNNNQLNGSVPSWIGNFPELNDLYLSTNSFQGSIPAEMGNLTSLEDLQMEFSGISGNLPSELGNLTSLIHILLDQNDLGGSIPDSFGNLKSLSTLNLASNSLVGAIPSSLGDITNMTQINLSDNKLSGLLPDGFGNLSYLTLLDLYQNNLAGPIPTQWSQLSNLLTLDLHQNNLAGPIPTQFSQLSNLVTLDLSYNSLTGAIPQKLVMLPNLTDIYLQDNCLNGTVPTYNNTKTHPLTADFGVGQNSNCFNATQGVCKCATAPVSTPSGSPRPAATAGGDKGLSKTAQHVYIAIGVIAGSLLALMALLVLCFVRHKRQFKSTNPSSTYKGPVRQYSCAEVRDGTDDFTTKVGEGAFATVYRAVFKDGTVAAVKRFNKKKPLESFDQEVVLLSHLHHRFLVNLIGYCQDSDAGEHMLLYEFMDRGNLNENLHGRGRFSGVPLTWRDRVRVIISVAHGIEYLHYGTSPPLIHRDIKSANILLSSSGTALIAKVADFGLGRQTEIDSDEMMSTLGHEPPKAFPTRIAGTPGYFDPEYINTSVLSPLTDVFSFGVVLLELITGRSALLEERSTLSHWAKPFLDNEDILPIVDPKLQKGDYDEEQLRAVAELARRCVENDSRMRPTIKDVVAVLTELFRAETGMVNPSLRVDYSESSSMTDSQSRVLNISRVLAEEPSVNYCTESEILPRD